MRRLLALTLGIATLSGVGASLAHAAVSPPRPNPAFNADGTLTPDAWNVIQDPVQFPPPSPNTQNAAPEAERRSVIDRARRAGRVLPSLKTLGTITVAASGLDFGWRVGGIPGGFIYNKLTSSAAGGSVLFNSAWIYDSAGTPLNLTLHGDVTPTVYDNHWHYRNTTDGLNFFCIPTGGSCHASYTVGWANTAAAAAIGSALRLTDASCAGSGSRECYARVATDAQYEAAIQSERETQAAYDGRTVHKQATTYVQPTYITGDQTNAAGAYGTTGSQTNAQADAETDLAGTLDPGYDPTEDPSYFVLLEPGTQETYIDYITRLRAAGWLGTATVTVLAEDPALGAGAVQNIAAYAATTFLGTYTRPWDSPAPSLANDTNLRLRVNPGSAAGTPTTFPPTTIPDPTGIDFTPITDLDGACSFPFGFLCYAQEVTGWFDVSPNAPVFDFDVTVPELAGGGTIAYTVDLNILDAYMVLIRGIISVVLWIGAVYFLAVNLLGFRAGGDPGEAADEALHV